MSYRSYRPARYSMLPDIPEPGALARYADSLAVIVPVARTNLVRNPSLETNTTDWAASGGSIARSTAEQYHGAYSLAVTPTAATTDGVFSGLYSLTSGVTYAVSVKVKGAAGVPYRLVLINNTATQILASYSFRGTGRWQWVWLFYTETSTTTRYVVIGKDGSPSTTVFYVDGLQIEACGTEGVFVTTYIDGDQRGLIANQYPPAYLWTGTPHASTSSRSGQTRAGGRVLRFKDFGFLLTALIGLGLAPPQVDALSFAQLDGAQYVDTLKPARSFTLVGRFDATTPRQMAAQQGQLAATLDRDRVGARQPLLLTMQAERGAGEADGDAVTVEAVYTGGLEGQAVNLPAASAPITFTQYVPYVTGGGAGAALTVQTSVANANYILQRSASGVWSALGTGMNARVDALARGLDGTIYAGGNFTDAGGSGADYIAAYSPATGTWSVLGSATALNARVWALAVGPDGRLYVGGDFTNASGIANADYIAVWDGSTWAALGTGMNAGVDALAFAPDGTLYATGNFTTAGGGAANYIAGWNGSAWAALGTGLGPPGSGGLALVAGLDGRMYVGGGFSTANGVSAANIAVWTGTTFAALGSGVDNIVRTLAVGPDGRLYVGGDFTDAGGTGADYIAVWNGASWAPLGGTTALNNNVFNIRTLPNGTLFAGGNLTTAGGVTLPDRFAFWNGAAWVTSDVDLPNNPAVVASALAPDGTLTIGYTQMGSATAAALTTVTNQGTAAAWPTVIIRGPSSGTSRIYQIANTTTGQTIYLNLTLNAGETAVLTLEPDNLTFVSTFQGNVIGTILPGSQAAGFVLQPGANTISFFAAGSTVTAVMQWENRYLSLDDALYQVGRP